MRGAIIYPTTMSSSNQTATTITDNPPPREARHEMCTKYQQIAQGKLARLIVLKTILPSAVLMWYLTKSWLVVSLVSPFLMAFLVLIQSAFGLTLFRIIHGTPPIPTTPRHGVVVVNPQDHNKTPPSADKKQGQDSEEDITDGILYDLPYQSVFREAQHKSLLKDAQKQKPLRLLMVGDSLAIGVGQGKWPTPVMPETIAKTMSKNLGGRAVYWTCHGQTGASIGWVIRELDRGIEYLSRQNSLSRSTSCASEASSDDESTLLAGSSSLDSQQTAQFTPCSGLVGGGDIQALAGWRARLMQHRERFDPHLNGFYDIVVVLTGPNDAKSATLPFMLTGEDGELRKQAQQRGGGFGGDLQLLLETLGKKMQVRLNRLRKSVEAAAESVRDRMETSMERIAPGSMTHLQQYGPTQQNGSTGKIETEPQPWPQPSPQPSPRTDRHHHDHRAQHHRERAKHGHPLVVFPGLPNAALPVFQNIPICWYGGPPISFYGSTAVDILDAHKRDVACSFPEDIVFVRAPNRELATEYMELKGMYFEKRQMEEVVLSVRDISDEESEEREQVLKSYYEKRGHSAYHFSPFRTIRRLLGVPIDPYYKCCAVDGVHANEVGYDFWGRYLGHAIYQAWKERECRAHAPTEKGGASENKKRS